MTTQIETFYDAPTFTLTYVVYDDASRDAVVIDPVRDYDPASGKVSFAGSEKVGAFIEKNNLKLHTVLETHAHADHLSGSQLLKQRHGAKVAIGARITEVQETFRGLFDLGPEFRADGSQFDKLFADGETAAAGSLSVRVLATPGHTPACVSYVVGDAVFTGDALFMEDYGTGRCDFPRGSADDLYQSIQKLYALPDATRVFVGHDYQPEGRAMRFETTIGASKRANVQLRAETSREEFVKFRQARDATLAAPRLLLPSVQVNVNAGLLPRPRANGKRYLNVPINLFHPTDDIGNPAK